MPQRRRGQPTLLQTWDTDDGRTPCSKWGYRGIEAFSAEELAVLTAKAAVVLKRDEEHTIPFHVKRRRVEV